LERAAIADVWVKVRRYCGDVPCSERYTSACDFEADALRHLQPVEVDQRSGDVGSPAKIEDHTVSSILDGLQARNEDIRESEQDAVAIVEPRKDQ
jgi:creatinine amidohydrolase/Fe(II)-dependent formamide hydrolase-like protein